MNDHIPSLIIVIPYGIPLSRTKTTTTKKAREAPLRLLARTLRTCMRIYMRSQLGCYGTVYAKDERNLTYRSPTVCFLDG